MLKQIAFAIAISSMALSQSVKINPQTGLIDLVGSTNSSGDATNPSGIELPELSSNGVDLTWIVGATSLTATQSYMWPSVVGSYGKGLLDSGTTVSLDPDGAGPDAARTVRILGWYNVPVQIKSAVYTLSIDNSTVLTSIGAISMPALPAGSTMEIHVNVKNTSGQQWELEPRVGSTAIFMQRDPVGADTGGQFFARCTVYSTTSLQCGGLHTRQNGATSSIDAAGPTGLAVFDKNLDVTAAWTLNLFARTLVNTTTDIPFGIKVMVYAAN